ncbi:MAG: 4-hydroxybenzoate octaprenyltransferase [Pseudomonadota bacterium]
MPRLTLPTFFTEFTQRLQNALQQKFPVVYRRAPDFWRLMRMDRPIGIFLLLWPTLWCLWIAAQGVPDIKLLVIFILGTTCMRAAGCCINDYADRNFDGHVQRTRNRPIPAGKISPKEALQTCAVLCVLAFVLVLFTNTLTILMAFGGLAITVIYPFMKRHTHLAQLVLGAAFSWGGLMAFTAQTGTLPIHAWLLYIANFIWTVVYDTEYAMVDRSDDLKIGVKSTAILFAEADRVVIGILQILFLLSLSISAQHFNLGLWFQLGLVIAAFMFVYQQMLIYQREPSRCFQAFLHNHKVGFVIFIFTVLDLAIAN